MLVLCRLHTGCAQSLAEVLRKRLQSYLYSSQRCVRKRYEQCDSLGRFEVLHSASLQRKIGKTGFVKSSQAS